MINIIISQRMKMLRKSLNLTQKQFAHYVPGKVDYTYIGKIERGKQYPSIKMLEKVALSYGVPVSYFFYTTDRTAGNVQIWILFRDAVRTWRLRTQDLLIRSIQDLDENIKGILEDSIEDKNKTD